MSYYLRFVWYKETRTAEEWYYLDKAHLNSLVVSYRNGDEEALGGIFDAVNPLIERASRDLEYLVDNYSKFDCRIVMKVKRLIETFDHEEHDFIGAVKAIIGDERAFLMRRAVKKNEKYPKVSKERLEESSENWSGVELQSQEKKIEDALILKEKIALLAQGDQRKEIILTQWARGATDVSISQLLAQLFGGKEKSHWRFIMRFKTKCRNLLAEEALV
jgi:hypothetical protein